MSPSDAAAKLEQDAVTEQAIDLLRRAACYLERLPAVPATRELAKELSDFVDSPRVRASARATCARADAASAKYANVVAASGLILFQVVVEGNALYLKAPPIGGYLDDLGRMRTLHEGARFQLETTPSDFVPWHLDLVIQPPLDAIMHPLRPGRSQAPSGGE